MTAFIENIRKMMGWCPVADTKIKNPPSVESYVNNPDSGGGASPKVFASLFEWDYIVKEELWRSIAVLFYTFIGIGMLISYGYIKADLTDTFFLAPIATFAFFIIMVWYRKNMQGSITRFEDSRPVRELAILVAIYALYLSLALQYPVLHKVWFFILLFIALRLTKIFELNFPSGVKMMLFYAASCIFILVRYYIFQMPLMSLLKDMLAFGVAMLAFVVLAKRAGFEEPGYLHRIDRRGVMLWIAIIAICVIIWFVASIGIDKMLS